MAAILAGACLAAGCGEHDARSSLGMIRQMLSDPRPDLTSERTQSEFSGNGHTLSYDGRLIIAAEGHAGEFWWRVRAFRPEAVTYGSDGRPRLQSGQFSPGMTIQSDNGENALALCATSADQIGNEDVFDGYALYTPFIMDSDMREGAVPHIRRRTFAAAVQYPNTLNAEVAGLQSGTAFTYLKTVDDQHLFGIELTMTNDGRLLVFQGAQSNDGQIDHLMYSYNENPCAELEWTTPRPLHQLYAAAWNAQPGDIEYGLRAYPIAFEPLRAGTGELFDDANPIHGAYPWLDPEGRNVLYTAAPHTGSEGGRRQVVSMIGADVGYAAHAIDGGINPDMATDGDPKLFYSSPMWNFEKDQPGGAFDDHYLPVADGHDVLPLFGSNTHDYNEFDIGNVEHPADLLYADMFPLIQRDGFPDNDRTADRSGLFHRLSLTGNAQLAYENPSLPGTHARGYALALGGAGHLRMAIEPAAPPITVPTALRAFSVEFMVNPDASLEGACAGNINPWWYIADAPGTFNVIYEANGSLHFSLVVDGEWVRLGFSPPLARGRWSHVAFTWDGFSGQFHEYINGLDTQRLLPEKAGAVVRPDSLTLGSRFDPLPQSCADYGGMSFKGKLDEFRVFHQARSQRSACNAALGADCKLAAIQGTPTTSQLLLEQLQPECSSASALNSVACRAAMHGVCAQRGARDALSSAQNVLDTAEQLISGGPPIPLGGVAVSASGGTVEVACMPIQHKTFPIQFEELAEQHEGCTDEIQIPTTACDAAARRKCRSLRDIDSSLDFTSGHLFDATSRGWLTCFNAAHIADVPGSSLGPSCGANQWDTAACRLEVSVWCRQAGYGGGVLQELPSPSVGHVHCFNASSTTQTGF